MKNQCLTTLFALMCLFIVSCDKDNGVEPDPQPVGDPSIQVFVVEGGIVTYQDDSLLIAEASENGSLKVRYELDVPGGYAGANLGMYPIEGSVGDIRISSGDTKGEFTVIFLTFVSEDVVVTLTSQDGRTASHTLRIVVEEDEPDEHFTGSWSAAGLTGPNLGAVLDLIKAQDGSLVAFAGYEPHRSTDGGQTWSKTSLPAGNAVAAVLHSDGTIYSGGYETKMYSSADNGASWQELQTDLPGGDDGLITTMIFHDGKFYLGLLDPTQGQDSKTGIYTSEDATKWTRLDESGLPNNYCHELLIAGTGDMYVVMNNPAEVFQSQDGGVHWNKMDFPEQQFLTDIEWYPYGDVVLISGELGVYGTFNRGDKWEHLYSGLSVANSTSVECIAVGPDREIFITPFGIGNMGPVRLGIYAAAKLDGEYEFLGEHMKGKWVETMRYIDGELFACTADDGLHIYK